MLTKPKYYGTPEYALVLERLKSVAKQGGPPINYAVIFELMKLKRGNNAAKEAGHLLGEISEQMHREAKPMLSALVVNRQEGIPGPGFFELAATLGKLSREATSQERKAFWEKELQAVHSTIW